MTASTEFAASLPFLGYKQRNAVLDNFFYDTTRLSLDERAKLTPLADREGSIIVVPPSNSDREIRHYSHALRFMTKEGPSIRAIAVAGVEARRSAPRRLPASIGGRARHRRRRHRHRLWPVGHDERGARRLVRLRRRRPDQTHHGARLRAHAPGRARRERHAAKRCRGDAGGDPARRSAQARTRSSPTARARWSSPTRSSAMSTISRATTASSSSACIS